MLLCEPICLTMCCYTKEETGFGGRVVWRPSLWGWRGVARRRPLCCLRGVLSVGSPARALLRRFLFLGVLSARDVVSLFTPHGFAYCKSSREQRVGYPAGQYLGWVSSYSLFTPHGFAYCKSSREQRVGYPARQYLGWVSSYSSSSVIPWDCASSF